MLLGAVTVLPGYIRRQSWHLGSLQALVPGLVSLLDDLWLLVRSCVKFAHSLRLRGAQAGKQSIRD